MAEQEPEGRNNSISLLELAKALVNEMMIFHYQPKISLITGRLSGAEALIRLIDPSGKTRLPYEFIPLAESTGFITEISAAMFPKLLADLLVIHDVDDSLSISFNLTGLDFESPKMSEMIEGAIRDQHLDPKSLQVELTEASIIEQGNAAVRSNLQRLVDLGVTLSMDDFGTGYSSIDTLSKWPFQVLKLDQGLISSMAESGKSQSIVQASIRMAHQLGIKIVAEGIETADIYDLLLRSGCTEIQGFWIARPMPLVEFLGFIERGNRWSGLPTGFINMAMLDHIHWRQSLVTQVINKSFGNSAISHPILSPIELDHTHCDLGQWYYGQGQEFRGYEAFDKLEEPHRHLHALGRELIEAAENGISRDKVVALLRDLAVESGNVLRLLQELETMALLRQTERIAESGKTTGTMETATSLG